MKEKIKIGIVGSKFAADFHAFSYARTSGVEIAAVAAIDNLEPFAKKWNIPKTYADYKEMLAREDLDLVSVCAPNFLHHDIAVAAARAGKHVFCEKPLATTTADARDIIATCRTAGVKLFYGEDWCFAPPLKRMIEVIGEGGVGKVLYVKAKECHNGTHSPFAKKKETCGGGCLIHLAIHPIGWVLHLLGQSGNNKVVEVFGKCNGGLRDNYVHQENGGEDFALGVMKFANGEHALIEGNYITVGGMDDKVEVYGTEGNIKADLTFGSCLNVYSRPGYKYVIEKTDNTLGWTKPAVDEFLNLGYVDELAYAVDCVRRNEEPMYGCSGALGLACIEIISAMYQSHETGAVVRGKWG
ncbi:MAG: Gfo/Idh/MocA family oxidoreductase [Verrucomicrobia bacterium]|nr:Gfo/Idh/MocA family oxidoreductase [Verrucomicrobiota bacterium]MCG2679215.1 Gfo/Idh/MocA family oxidoreductase [Kiritimatiellia bacterium]MBU4248608.1 Gfo/Idh/MocA family oxidoreductase [Verrucomicrobiota bacterium]MBU4290070.1 Gfo/Idh/MocA family oxidoreductase [Verrucomicrobiota bacterium]MBU4430346.1 Gfo/Idh/MocA family oxidoreductase [Verrucomicrobiota bacterium]